MKALLAIEWLKIKRYRTFWILTILFAVLILSFNLLADSGVLSIGGGNKQQAINIINGDYSFSSVWLNTGYWTKLFTGLLAVIIVILTTNEYQFRTNRQNVIDGWQRTQFFNAKWGLAISLSLIVTLFTFVMGFTFAMVNGSSFSNIYMHAEKIFYVFLLSLNYFGLALTLSLFLKRTGMSVLIFLLYTYIIEFMLSQLLNHKVMENIGNFLPLQCSAELLTYPFPELVKQMVPMESLNDSAYVFASIGWIIIYYFSGRWKLLKGDW
jgi:ABC-2 type transport system permease protein